jgi:hypothetical protein
MVFQLLEPLKSQVRQPLLNERGYNLSFDDMKRYIIKRIMNQIKHTPELVGMLDTLVTEHFLGPVDFYDVNGHSLGPTQLKKARKFWHDQKVKQIFQGMGFDYFSDGSCFGWVGTAEDAATIQFRDMAARIKTGFNNTSFTASVNRAIDEELVKPRKLAYIAASTTEVLHDEFGTLSYRQEASGRQIIWREDQIVHIKLMEFNGEVRSFSGMKALTEDIALMYMIKENLLAKMENGGSPDNIIAVNGGIGQSKGRFDRLKTALESFSHLKKSHGNMPIDADVSVLPLGATIKDMEFRELAMFTISEFCLALGVPISRIPFLTTGAGGPTNKGELSSGSDAPYEEKKNSRRDTWEDAWNPVFEKLGFTIKFRRTNLMDEIREVTCANQRAAFCTAVSNNLSQAGKKLTTEALLEVLSGDKNDFCEDDIEDMPIQVNVTESSTSGIQGQGGSPSKKSTSSVVKRDYIESKQVNADNKGVSA